MDNYIFWHIRQIEYLDRADDKNNSKIEKYFSSLDKDTQDAITDYYKDIASGSIPDICRTELQTHKIVTDPKKGAFDNYLILEELNIHNPGAYLHNFNALPKKIQKGIINIYGEKLLKKTEIYTGKNFKSKLRKKRIKSRLKQNIN